MLLLTSFIGPLLLSLASSVCIVPVTATLVLNLSAPLLKLVEVVDSTYATAHQLAATVSDGEAGDGHRGLCALLAQTEDALALMANKLIFLLIEVRRMLVLRYGVAVAL